MEGPAAQAASGWMVTSVRVPWAEGVVHALRVAARTTQPRFTAVFVHGADRVHQNAEHWRPHLPALAAAFPAAELYAVDLPGHGLSEPGAQAAAPPSDAATVQALAAFLAHVHRRQPLVLVGRSKGGRQACQAACQAAPAVQAALAALVLVAPAVNRPFVELLPPRVRATPTLLFWALDDPVVPYATHTALTDSMPVCDTKPLEKKHTLFRCVFFFMLLLFSNSLSHTQNVVFHSFGNVLSEGETARWKAHCPENERPEEFHKVTTDFLCGIFQN